MRVTIFTDGGARNNPGPAGVGAVILDDQNRVLGEVSEYIGPQTNNFAEYEAVLRALMKAKHLGLTGADITFKLDSKLVVEQLSGNWKIKEATLFAQADMVHQALREFGVVTFNYVPRAQNAEADRLVNAAIDKAQGR